MHKELQLQGERKTLYESPQVEVVTMNADAVIMQTSGEYDSEALDPLTGVDLGDIWGSLL